MAVYTQLTSLQVETLLNLYDLGDLASYSEISAGIENTNYFLDIYPKSEGEGGQSKRYVLTIFENLSSDTLPFFNDLTTHLAQKGFNVPAPIPAISGEQVIVLQGKPAMIVNCLSGAAEIEPSTEQCKAMASCLAQMHLALRDFPRRRPLTRDSEWMEEQIALLSSSSISDGDMQMLKQAVLKYRDDYFAETFACPQGIVHGDLFRDNVLFEGQRVSGVIDFYHACQATLLFDLAVMVNDWAWDVEVNAYNRERLEAIVTSYQAERPWTDKEKEVWPRCLELAALRFWISRLVSLYVPGYQQNSVEGDTAKNPDEMKRIMLVAQSM